MRKDGGGVPFCVSEHPDFRKIWLDLDHVSESLSILRVEILISYTSRLGSSGFCVCLCYDLGIKCACVKTIEYCPGRVQKIVSLRYKM